MAGAVDGVAADVVDEVPESLDVELPLVDDDDDDESDDSDDGVAVVDDLDLPPRLSVL